MCRADGHIPLPCSPYVHQPHEALRRGCGQSGVGPGALPLTAKAPTRIRTIYLSDLVQLYSPSPPETHAYFPAIHVNTWPTSRNAELVDSSDDDESSSEDEDALINNLGKTRKSTKAGNKRSKANKTASPGGAGGASGGSSTSPDSRILISEDSDDDLGDVGDVLNESKDEQLAVVNATIRYAGGAPG